MSIDAEKLEKAIQRYEVFNREDLKLVTDAASAHLATLPRYKEVEVVRWALYEDNLSIMVCTTSDEVVAKEFVPARPGNQSVRLTGTAKVRA